MNNDVKETLQYLKDDSKSFIICGVSYYKITDYKTKILLEYITNLQEERDFYKCTDSMNVESNIELRARIDKAIEYIKEHQRKDEFLNLNEWQTRNLLNILEGEKQ